ncbi:MAG: hypothetical protein ABIK36_11805 [Pseudomonadota bacterium]
MQIVETSSLGLRSARLVFRNRDSSVSVAIYPMVHVGEARFFSEAFDEAFAHDVVLVEGVRSSVGRNLTRSYRWIDFGRLGLVQQPKTPPQETVAARIITADLSTAEFEREWRMVPFGYRAMFLLLAPLYGIYMRLLGSREIIAKHLALEDLASAEESLSWDPAMDGIHNAIIHARDRRLIECLRAELESPLEARKRIAVIYGARHMRAVLRELTGRRFICEEANWQTVFPL